jgi:hypothetical protein
MPLMAAAVRGSETGIATDTPHELSRIASVPDTLASPYHPTPDGQRFLVFRSSAQASTPPLTVITNWQVKVKR